MIRLTYIKNPFAMSGKVSWSADFQHGKTVKEYFEGTDLYTDGVRYISMGQSVDDDHVPENGHDIVIMQDIGDPVTMVIITNMIWAALVWAFWAAVIYSVYMAITYKAPSNSMSGNDGLEGDSPTYSWDGITTTQEVGRPIPVVYGEHMLGGNIINAFVQEDGEKTYFNILLALCEGEIESVTSVLLNDNPITNYSTVTTETRLGTNTQAVIANFNDLHNVNNINSKLMKDAAYTYTTSNTDVEGFDIKLQFPSGLYYQNTGDGSMNSWDVSYKVEYKLHADGSYTTAGTFTISAKARNAVNRIYSKRGLTAGQYDIRITRTSDDSDFTHSGDMYLYYIDEINTDDLAYPNTALLGLKLLATDQLSGASPNITSLVRGRKVLVPQVMNGASEVAWEDYYWNVAEAEYRLLTGDTSLTWDGTTYVSRWCANPAWCIKDLLLNERFGLGQYVTSAIIDNAMFLDASRWCDEKVPNGLGGYEKRMRLDIVMDSNQRAIDMIAEICAATRMLMFFSGGSVKIRPDKPEIPSQLFGMGNIIAGSFQQGWKGLRDTPNVIEVQYPDASKNYTLQQIAVIDEASLAAGNPVRKKQIQMFTTRVSQALREGRYCINSAKYCDESVTFKVGIDALAVQAGDVIGVCHDLPAWGFSGRVKTDSTTTLVKLSDPVTLDSGKTYKVQVRFADDTIEERTISNAPGTYTEVSVSSAFSNAPADYDVYCLGVSNLYVKPFRVVNIQRNNDLECSITAIEHNANIYDDTTVVIPQDNYSALDFEVADVQDIQLTERLVLKADGTVESAIDVWFTPPSPTSIHVFYKSARVYLSDNGGIAYRFIAETQGGHVPIIGDLVDGTTYKVAIVSVTQDGKSTALSSAPTASLTLIGKSASPDDVAGFLLNQMRDRLKFSWTKNADVDLSGYEIRRGQSWESGEIVAAQLKSTNFTDFNLREGSSQSYWIKAVDTSGNYSETPTEAVVTIDNIPFTNIVQSYTEQTAWSGTKTDVSKVGDNLELDTNKLTGTYETAVKDIGYICTPKINAQTVVVDASSDRAWDDSETATWDESETERWSGAEVVGAVDIEIRTSEDNSTWTAYKTWQAGDYKCRYYQLKITLSRADVGKTIQMTELNHGADLPDVDDVQDCTVSVAADGCAVTFVKTFHEDPALNVTILTGDGMVWKASSLDTTGVTIKLYDLTGTVKTGTFRLHIHGV